MAAAAAAPDLAAFTHTQFYSLIIIVLLIRQKQHYQKTQYCYSGPGKKARCGIASWDDATEKLISCSASLGTFRFMTISSRLSFITGFSEGLS